MSLPSKEIRFLSSFRVPTKIYFSVFTTVVVLVDECTERKHSLALINLNCISLPTRFSVLTACATMGWLNN